MDKEMVTVEKAYLDELLAIAKANQEELKTLKENLKILDDDFYEFNQDFNSHNATVDSLNEDFSKVYKLVHLIAEKNGII